MRTRSEALERLHHWTTDWDRHGLGYWTVLTAPASAPPALVGFCGLKIMPLLGEPALNLFYRLAPTAWHQGYATEAAAAAVAWAARHRPDLPLVARVRPDNLASQRVATRIGLHRAPHLDHGGEDGPDLPYQATHPRPPSRCSKGRSGRAGSQIRPSSTPTTRRASGTQIRSGRPDQASSRVRPSRRRAG
ncbi:GNAT family N-acetyltransferase [Dactylosporangium sp. NPDC000521]|uniref:GNAT family N-acetyltransferase n=1 Tax=Dactylosporangium sp. NPDC000521 TaxID=3363975 RepID=UPI00368501E2